MTEHLGRYPYFGEPPVRRPRPAAQEPALRGKRVVLSTPEGFVYDMRAASEVYTDGQGRAFIDIIAESEWYGVRAGNDAPRDVVAWPAHLVWVD